MLLLESLQNSCWVTKPEMTDSDKAADNRKDRYPGTLRKTFRKSQPELCTRRAGGCGGGGDSRSQCTQQLTTPKRHLGFLNCVFEPHFYIEHHYTTLLFPIDKHVTLGHDLPEEGNTGLKNLAGL